MAFTVSDSDEEELSAVNLNGIELDMDQIHFPLQLLDGVDHSIITMLTGIGGRHGVEWNENQCLERVYNDTPIAGWLKTHFKQSLGRFLVLNAIGGGSGASSMNMDIEKAANKQLRKGGETVSGNSHGPESYDFRTITETTSPSVVCGAEFKINEPTYRCKDCEVDATCALCFSCFQSSKHKDHKYVLVQSEVSGTCDCGDVEAWTQYARCDNHTQPETGNPTTAVSLNESAGTVGGTMCAAAFKENEPTYRCKDCETDETCAFCFECFNASEHTSHNIIVDSSGGVGTCDCGDPEAWKKFPYCSKHSGSEIVGKCSKGQGTSKKEKKVLTPAVRVHWKKTIKEVVGFVDNALAGFKNECCFYKSQSHARMRQITSTTYAVVATFVKNSYPFIIAANFRAIIGLSEEDSMDLAMRLTGTGRTIVFIGERHDPIISMLMRRDVLGVQFRLVEISIAMQEEAIIAAVDWLTNVCKEYPALREDVCDAVSVNLGEFLANESVYWKGLRKSMNGLYLSSMLIIPEWRKMFAYEFMGHYAVMQKNFMEKGFKFEQSALSMTVQFLTSPSIVQGRDIRTQLLTDVYDLFKPYVSTQMCTLNTEKDPRKMARGNHMLDDLNYVVRSSLPIESDNVCAMIGGASTSATSRPARQCNTKKTKSNCIIANASLAPETASLVEQFFKLIALFQAVDSQTRIERSQNHVLYEDLNWTDGLDRSQVLYGLCKSFMTALSANGSSLLASIRKCVTLISESRARLRKRDMKNPNELIVSVHLPLHQCLSVFVRSFASQSGDVAQLWPLLDTRDIIPELVKALTFKSQVAANLWVRNGNPPREVALRYHRDMRQILYDPQLYLLQICFYRNENNADFLMRELVDAFAVGRYLQKVDTPSLRPPVKCRSDDKLNDWDTINLLLIDMIHLVIAVCFERPMSENEHEGAANAMRREIIEWLTIKPVPYSALADKVLDVYEKEHFDRILKELAVHETGKRSGNTGHIYKLKDEFKNEFTPHFSHFTNSDRDAAMKKVLHMAKEGNYLDYFKMSVNVEEACRLLRILVSPTFLTIIGQSLILARTETPKMSGALMQSVFWTLIVVIRLERISGNNLFTSALDSLLRSVKHSKGLSLAFVIQQCQCGPFGDDFSLLLGYIARAIESGNDATMAESSPSTTTTINNKRMRTSDNNPDDAARALKRQRQEQAVLRREAIMAKFAKQQQQFLDKNKPLQDAMHANTNTNKNMVKNANGEAKEVNEQENCLIVTCIMCQDDEKINSSSLSSMSHKPISAIAHIQESGVIDHVIRSLVHKGEKRHKMKDVKDYKAELFLDGCGHAVHNDCLKRYIDSIRSSRSEQPLGFVEDIDVGEFLCPMCKRLGNVLIPYADCPPTPSLHINRGQGDGKVLKENMTLELGNENSNVQANMQEMALYKLLEPILTSIRHRFNRSLAWLSLRHGPMPLPIIKNKTPPPKVPIEDVMWYTIASMELAGRCGAHDTSNTYSSSSSLDADDNSVDANGDGEGESSQEHSIGTKTRFQLLKLLYKALVTYRSWSLRCGTLADVGDVSAGTGVGEQNSVSSAAIHTDRPSHELAYGWDVEEVVNASIGERVGSGASVSGNASVSRSVGTGVSMSVGKIRKNIGNTRKNKNGGADASGRADVSSHGSKSVSSSTRTSGDKKHTEDTSHSVGTGWQTLHVVSSDANRHELQVRDVRLCTVLLSMCDEIECYVDAGKLVRMPKVGWKNQVLQSEVIFMKWLLPFLRQSRFLYAVMGVDDTLPNMQPISDDAETITKEFKSMCETLLPHATQLNHTNLTLGDLLSIESDLATVNQDQVPGDVNVLMPKLNTKPKGKAKAIGSDRSKSMISSRFPVTSTNPDCPCEVSSPLNLSSNERSFWFHMNTNRWSLFLLCQVLRDSKHTYDTHHAHSEEKTGVQAQTKTDLTLEPKLYMMNMVQDYNEIVYNTTTQKCFQCKTSPRHAALCLLCGETVCFLSQCCQYTVDMVKTVDRPNNRSTIGRLGLNLYQETVLGECNYHAGACGNGIGMFLCVKDCSIVLVSPGSTYHGKGANVVTMSPYLDAHGESGEGLKLGHVLKWDRQRAKQLMSLYLNHSALRVIAYEHGQYGNWNRL
eukprot:CFRG1981T1